MSTTTSLVSKKRADYQAPSYAIDKVDIRFDLSTSCTRVINSMRIRRIKDSANTLVLDGENLSLTAISIDGNPLIEGQDFRHTEQGLEINSILVEFELCIENTINPEANTSLEGLYFSNQAFCTQCEAEGFRKITYFLDRPDVLSTYTVTIISRNPAMTYLLSNGNLVEDSGYVEDVRTTVWHDPHPKPCYLFALVAGHFDLLEDKFVTTSGREVSLQLYVDEGRRNQGQHALNSLKRAMQWDQDTYGLEYDLDIYMIVAVDFFNMGAMENKGLNVFNSKFVLADPQTATDKDYFNIESIIAHEYFHNWTGNRVTCRDWFQLSLKEGLTVFRDQQFSADMFSYLQTRIEQVKVMQERQFAEDAGPMSHPIRPDEVMEMNNFYTVTVYDKGAEVIRMLHTLLGKQGFRKGMDVYFSRHDGCAVTCDDFVDAMEAANQHDLSHFKRWYSQSGTPLVSVFQTKNEEGHTILTFTQSHQATADQIDKQALYIPIKLECITQTGNVVNTGLENDTFLLLDDSADLNLGTIEGEVTPSLLQDFSSPVRVNYSYSASQLLLIIAHAKSDYAKWEASQRLFVSCFENIYSEQPNISSQGEAKVIKDEYTKNIHAYSKILQTLNVSKEVLSQLLALPDIEACMAKIDGVQPLVALASYEQLVTLTAAELSDFCLQVYHQNIVENPYEYTKTQANQRQLKAASLMWLACAGHPEAPSIITTQYSECDNMTDKLSALYSAQKLLEMHKNDIFDSLMLEFEQQYSHDAVVMDKWFALHATTQRNDILAHLDLLQSHQQFSTTNPNKLRAVIGSFAFFNVAGFHKNDGSGYKYLCDHLFEIDKINPQIASRLITPLIQYSNLDTHNQGLIKTQLHRLFGSKNLSKDLFEKISKSLTS